MSKALVISRNELLKFPREDKGTHMSFVVPAALLYAQLWLEDRSTCETDDSVIQILPYMVIKDSVTGKYFSYRRGSKGGEARLKGKCSIGLGGHLEELPFFNTYKVVASTVAMGALRELNEEVGIDLTFKNFYDLEEQLLLEKFSLIYSTRDNVDKYHLCMLIQLEFDARELTKLEDGVIQDIAWLSKEELGDAHWNFSRYLEGWSDIALTYLK